MLERLIERLKGKKKLILGFGREGRATLMFLSRFLPGEKTAVADINTDLDHELGNDLQIGDFHTGPSYLDHLDSYQMVIKSPGINIPAGRASADKAIVTSQTALFLEYFRDKTIGITGTKGKSTTSSLIHHLLSKSGIPSMLVGNIGKPPFEALLEHPPSDTRFVYELSSYQLEDIKHSPSTAIMLNLYPEHLDRYGTTGPYYDAKWNINRYQKEGDLFICNADNANIAKLLTKEDIRARLIMYSIKTGITGGWRLEKDRIFELSGEEKKLVSRIRFPANLPGKHNQGNVMAALIACREEGVPPEAAIPLLDGFKGLPHRMEYLGQFRQIHFYNDSIATIPEATISALDALPAVDTLILGGYDRGLEYDELAGEVIRKGVKSVILTGPAGRRIHKLLISKGFNKTLYFIPRFEDIARVISDCTPANGVCLLSPAASSYDQFTNFEERGKIFANLLHSI